MTDALIELEGLDPAVRGSAFERLIKWWLTADPVYAAQVRRTWLWSEWPGRWGPDAGIDIVAETRDGSLWAIQTKAYAVEATVTKASVDSFLSESNRAVFTHRLLVATTDRIAPNALRAIHGQEKTIGLVRRVDLVASPVHWPVSLARLDGSRAPSRHPRPHQLRAVADVIAGLAVGGRGQLLMACGTGKTLTALWAADGLQSQLTLVLVPSLSLLEQTMREWLAEASEPFQFIAVCSDESVVAEHDEPVAYTSDLGVPVTTDARRVQAFLQEAGRRVVFATYHSSPVVAAAQAPASVPVFDLVVADEAHRCAGQASGAFATVLDDVLIRAERRLFMTATPRYFTRRLRRQAREADVELASMDDEAVFGPVLHRLTFGEAITRELLSDYRVVVTAVDHPTYAAMAAKAALVRGEGLNATDARTLACELTVLRAMRRYGLRRVLSFHGRVRGARQFATELGEVAVWAPESVRPSGRLWTAWVSGEMNVGERVARLDYFRHLDEDERALLANARCLSEGVDVPSIDGVTFVDPRRSQVDVVQAVGRAIRLSPDKTLGTIIIPVVINPEDDVETTLRSSDFANVWDIVNALRAHDDELAEELDAARRSLGRTRATGERPGKLILDLPTAITADFARSFDARLIEATASTWEFWFGVLESYVERTGHARVQQNRVEDALKLGNWVAGQRLQYWQTPSALTARGEKLNAERIARLESLPGWQWSSQQAAWEDGFAALQGFVEREGTAHPIERQSIEGGYGLGEWVAGQRKKYKGGRLPTDRIERLESVRGWTWNKHDAAWEDGYSALLVYANREGTARTVPKGHVEDGYRLADWVKAQRHKGRLGQLKADRRRRLDRVPGWSWSISPPVSDNGRPAEVPEREPRR